MKKIFAIAIVAMSMNALADHHAKHMVTLSGYETGDSTDRSLNFANSTGGNGDDKQSQTSYALNYAYAITDSVQVGARYASNMEKENGNDTAATKSMGLQVIYNFAHKLSDTCYAAVHYDVTNSDETEDSSTGAKQDDEFKTNTWTLEFGHRWSLGTIGGMNFNYSPSVNLAFAKTDFDKAGDDDSATTSVTLNFVKFDVLF